MSTCDGVYERDYTCELPYAIVRENSPSSARDDATISILWKFLLIGLLIKIYFHALCLPCRSPSEYWRAHMLAYHFDSGTLIQLHRYPAWYHVLRLKMADAKQYGSLFSSLGLFSRHYCTGRSDWMGHILCKQLAHLHLSRFNIPDTLLVSNYHTSFSILRRHFCLHILKKKAGV